MWLECVCGWLVGDNSRVTQKMQPLQKHVHPQKHTWAMNEGRPSSSMFLQRQMALKRSRHSIARAPTTSAPAVCVGSSKAWRMKSEKSLVIVFVFLSGRGLGFSFI